VRNRLAVFAVLAIGALAAAQDQDFSKVQIKVTKVSGNIYMLEGAGGNIAASVGEDGIVIVDDQYAPLADKIAAALKGIGVTDKPVRFVINTHYHGDHTGGNAPFASGGSTVIAQDNVRKRLETGGKAGVGSMTMEQKPAPKGGLPIITFEEDVTVHLNGEDIRALHFPAGHTDGDAIVFFPKANVVHMGDDFVRYGYPFIDIISGGSVQGIVAACDKVVATVPADAKVIPGHGQLSTISDVKDYSTMLKETTAAVQAAMKQGKTVDQMKKDKILAQWDTKYSGKFVNSDLFIETIYDSLTNQKTAPFVKHN
jgi:cyclase